MEKYIALLRGINISGKNKISMPLLKEGFEGLGYVNVKTYINSGNVIFSSEYQNKNQLIFECENMIQEKFLLQIPVVIISQKELLEALENAPKWWDVKSDEEVIHQAIFLVPPLTVEEVYKAVKEARPEYEKVTYFKNVIFYSALRATLSKSNWYKIASSSVNNKVTIRNASTLKKILTLFDE